MVRMPVSCRNAGMCGEDVAVTERALQEKGPLSLGARGPKSRSAATPGPPSSATSGNRSSVIAPVKRIGPTQPSASAEEQTISHRRSTSLWIAVAASTACRLALAAPPAHATTYKWVGTTTVWNTAANWSPSTDWAGHVSANNDAAIFDNTGGAAPASGGAVHLDTIDLYNTGKNYAVSASPGGPSLRRTVQNTVQRPQIAQKERDLHCCKSLSFLW
jgi:hypothetical protein